MADPLDLCSTMDSDSLTVDKFPIFIAKNGSCKSVVKAMHAQLAGAKMLIIVDNSDELPKDPVGHNSGRSFKQLFSKFLGFDIAIPTIIISKQNGDALIRAIDKSSPQDEKIRVSVTFSPVRSYLIQLSYFSRNNHLRRFCFSIFSALQALQIITLPSSKGSKIFIYRATLSSNLIMSLGIVLPVNKKTSKLQMMTAYQEEDIVLLIQVLILNIFPSY